MWWMGGKEKGFDTGGWLLSGLLLHWWGSPHDLTPLKASPLKITLASTYGLCLHMHVYVFVYVQILNTWKRWKVVSLLFLKQCREIGTFCFIVGIPSLVLFLQCLWGILDSELLCPLFCASRFLLHGSALFCLSVLNISSTKGHQFSPLC